jgi:hypothetical protein
LKLRKLEMMEIKRTHTNIFDWFSVQKENPSSTMEALETGDNDDRELLEILEKEERLERMEKRRQEWENDFLCRGIVEELLPRMRNELVKKMVSELVLEVVDRSSQAVEDILEIILELVARAEEEGKFTVLRNEIIERGMEQRMLEELRKTVRDRRNERWNWYGKPGGAEGTLMMTRWIGKS